jgi:hypothetical protein
MIELTLQSGEEIRLPITVDDVPAKAWYEMSARERELEKLGEKVEPADFIRYVTEAVKSVVDIPDNLAFGFPVKAMLKKEWQLTPEFIASVKIKGVDTIEATVLNIYRHLLFVTRTFQPCEFPIEYDGSLWQITPNLKGIAYEGEFTAFETVEVLRLEQMFEKELAEARKKEFDFTAIAAADYGLSQVQLAILLRPVVDGVIEPLPMGEQAIERYINERVAELDNLPYSVILSVRAFFLSFLTAVSVLLEMTKSLRETLNTPHTGLE